MYGNYCGGSCRLRRGGDKPLLIGSQNMSCAPSQHTHRPMTVFWVDGRYLYFMLCLATGRISYMWRSGEPLQATWLPSNLKEEKQRKLKEKTKHVCAVVCWSWNFITFARKKKKVYASYIFLHVLYYCTNLLFSRFSQFLFDDQEWAVLTCKKISKEIFKKNFSK